jgi:hypothetical protein
MVASLPITIGVVMLKILMVQGFHFEGLVHLSEIGLVITGGIFLIGFMLAGTLADYKESEKIPAEIAGTLEAIEDTVALCHAYKSDFDLDEQLKKVNEVTDAIIAYFAHRAPEREVYARIEELNGVAIHAENTDIGTTSSWVRREQTTLRKLFTRATVIKRTYFIATGYAFLETLTVVIVGLLLITKFENEVSSIILVSFVTQIFVYMIMLIKDIDHPFEYPENGKLRAADIDLFPLIEYDQRAKGRL